MKTAEGEPVFPVYGDMVLARALSQSNLKIQERLFNFLLGISQAGSLIDVETRIVARTKPPTVRIANFDIIIRLSSTTKKPSAAFTEIIHGNLRGQTASPNVSIRGGIIPTTVLGNILITAQRPIVNISTKIPAPPLVFKRIGEPLNIFSTTGQETINRTGNYFPAGGYYGQTVGMHTIAIRTANFHGTIYIEGTLSVEPGDDDWFPIILDGSPKIEFPRRGFSTNGIQYSGETATVGYTFFCNCIFLRARMDRSAIIPENSSPIFTSTFGNIEYIQLNY